MLSILCASASLRDRDLKVSFSQEIDYPLSSCNYVEVEMRIWIACFFILFAIAQLFDWIQQMSLPLPIYILGGLILAIASNSNKSIFGKVFDDFLTNAGYPGDRSIADSSDRLLDETKS